MAAALMMVQALAAAAQAWPGQSVHLIVPASPGSSLDVVARLIGERLHARWKEPVVVEDKAGAGGMLGMNVVAKAPPDGYTLGVGFNGPVAIAPHLYRRMAYDAARDLLPVVLTTSQPNVLAVAAGHPARTAADLVAWAKRQDGGLLYASVGNGSSSHLTMELIKIVAGFLGTHVPYKGSPEAAVSAKPTRSSRSSRRCSRSCRAASSSCWRSPARSARPSSRKCRRSPSRAILAWNPWHGTDCLPLPERPQACSIKSTRTSIQC
jgi:tripartite-type tricarboxylate transporter receptor subunit TctC